MSELKPEDVMRALECCSKDDCDNCPNDFGNCYANLAGYALALLREKNARIEELEMELDECVKIWNDEKKFLESQIAEKDAEIERLKARQENVSFVLKSAMKHYDALYEEAKEITKTEARAEAITEFAERLTGRFNLCDKAMYSETTVHDVIARVAEGMRVETEKGG